jgi:hypothetical protein
MGNQFTVYKNWKEVHPESKLSHIIKDKKNVKQLTKKATLQQYRLYLSGINTKNITPAKGVIEISIRILKISILDILYFNFIQKQIICKRCPEHKSLL